MSVWDLARKYGRGNSRALVNRAIRAELIGGDDALDSLDSLARLAHKWRRRGWVEGATDIDEALAATRRLVAGMEAEIRKRYRVGEGEGTS